MRQKIKEDYENFRRNKQQETVANKSSLKKLDRELNFKQSIPSALLDNNNNLKTNRCDMENIVLNFYNQLYESKVNVPEPAENEIHDVPDILVTEVIHAT